MAAPAPSLPAKSSPPVNPQKPAATVGNKFPWWIIIVLIVVFITWQANQRGGGDAGIKNFFNEIFGGNTNNSGSGSNSVPVSTTGRLFISISGGNGPYDIYVNGSLVGENSVTLTLLPGSYHVMVYNRSGTKIKDETSSVIAGKQSIVSVSGVW
jgi:hypothetical protein